MLNVLLPAASSRQKVAWSASSVLLVTESYVPWLLCWAAKYPFRLALLEETKMYPVRGAVHGGGDGAPSGPASLVASRERIVSEPYSERGGRRAKEGVMERKRNSKRASEQTIAERSGLGVNECEDSMW